MTFKDRFWAADWDGLYRFLADGNPPLALQILALNTIFFMIFIIRRRKAKHRMRSSVVQLIQLFLLLANFSLLLQKDVLRYLTTTELGRFIG